jgi:antitoxin HicB
VKVCIEISRDDKGLFTAVCPALPGCVSRGRTCEEAVTKIDEAIRGYVAALGNFVPDRLDHEVVKAPQGVEVS